MRIVVLAVAGLIAVALPSACSDPTSPPEPPGGRGARPILFIGRPEFPGRSPGQPAIYAVRGDGSGLRRVTAGADQALYPAWSRDGTRIAFAGGAGGGQEIWLMNADGSNPHRASAGFPTCVYQYTRITWSPSGTRLAAECWEDTYIFDLQSGESYSFTELVGRPVVHPDWSPDGTRLIFATAGLFLGDAYVAAPDGANVTQVLSGVADPAWSPDGRMVAFIARDSGRIAIHVANADGSGRRQVTPRPDSTLADEGPAWSPDGRWLTFHRAGTLCAEVGSPPVRHCIPHWSLWVVRTDGAGLRRLTPDTLQATRPSW